MGKGQVLAVLVVVGLVVAVMVVAWAEGGKKEGKASLDRVPAAVKEALLKEAKGGEVQEVKRRTQGDTVTYGADVVVEGKKTEVTLTADGTVTSRQAGADVENRAEGENQGENQETVTLDKVPAPVKKTLREGGQGREGPEGRATDGGRQDGVRGRRDHRGKGIPGEGRPGRQAGQQGGGG